MKFLIKMVLTLALVSFPLFAASDKNLHDFTVTSIELEDMSLDQYRGKTVLLVNTASFCGFTPQYEGLQTLYDTYKDDGLVVLGVPSNDFGDQEPGSEEEVKKFCSVNYNIQFPMTAKMVVNGSKETAELYNWLADEMGDSSRPEWNFHKYLINAEGKPVAFFNSRTEPMSTELRGAVEKELQGS